MLTLCSLGLSMITFFFKNRQPSTIPASKDPVIPKTWLETTKNPVTPAKDIRPADQTFLTFPEWFLVFSPEEQANYFKQHTATSFPYMKHTAQIWKSYRIVNQQIKGNFPTNWGYHFMIWVIGVSTTVEYTLKSCYETIVGRLTDTKLAITEEDQFNARFTQDYVDFIKDRPWYEFDFKSRLKDLWKNTSFSGPHFFRKWERKYILTSELSIKYVYGKLIGIGTKQVYGQALPTTAVVLDDDSLHYLPRYNKFAPAVLALAQKGHSFKEIAGNNSAILITVWVPAGNGTGFDNAITLFVQPISSAPSMKRVAIATPVSSLSEVLLQLEKEHIQVEHVFDF
ncbi:hypothetical protein SAMN05518672_101818 [Chitinophaga sp. CF118]|nr:hypothetical protein SAMN05518672_101818 [Chitinophaga sp. CF118]